MFLKISFPQIVSGKSTNVCVVWKGDWTEISTSAVHSGEVGNLNMHICGESGLLQKCWQLIYGI